MIGAPTPSPSERRWLRSVTAAAGIMSRVLVPCHVKGTVALQVGDVRTSQGRPGVLVIDVTFPSVAPFQVSQPSLPGRGGAELGGRSPGGVPAVSLALGEC